MASKLNYDKLKVRDRIREQPSENFPKRYNKAMMKKLTKVREKRLGKLAYVKQCMTPDCKNFGVMQGYCKPCFERGSS